MSQNGPYLKRTATRTNRAMDFFTEKGLTAETGHYEEAWPLVMLKELIDNSLDACENARVAPEIIIRVDNDGIAVSDNGTGIPADVIDDLIDFNVRVSTTAAYISPTRGQQGNAWMTLLAMPFVMSGGVEGQVEIVSRGVRHRITITTDEIRQQPDVSHKQIPDDRKNGAFVAVLLPDLASQIEEEVP